MQQPHVQGEWEAFLDLYGAGAMPPDSPNAQLMLAATLHQWNKVESILQELVQEHLSSEEMDVDDRRLDGDGGVGALCTVDDGNGSVLDGDLSGGDQENASNLHIVRSEASGGKPGVVGSNGAEQEDTGGDEGQPPAKRLRLSDMEAEAHAATPVIGVVGCRAAHEARSRSPSRPVARAGTPLPLCATGGLGAAGRSTVATGVDGAPISVEGSALLSRGSRSAVNGAGPAVGTPPRPFSMPAGLASRSASAPRPQATPQPPRRLDVSSLTWLIALLMQPQEPGGVSPHVGQPCLAMRDRILLLLRPMMNFQEKVAYFLEEQDHLLDFELSELGDDDTMHIEVHRGDEVLMDTVEQIAKAGDDGLMREMTVSFSGEDGVDGGGLLKEFCQVGAALLNLLTCLCFCLLHPYARLPAATAAPACSCAAVKSM
jgi:hypothetical protein